MKWFKSKKNVQPYEIRKGSNVINSEPVPTIKIIDLIREQIAKEIEESNLPQDILNDDLTTQLLGFGSSQAHREAAFNGAAAMRINAARIARGTND